MIAGAVFPGDSAGAGWTRHEFRLAVSVMRFHPSPARRLAALMFALPLLMSAADTVTPAANPDLKPVTRDRAAIAAEFKWDFSPIYP